MKRETADVAHSPLQGPRRRPSPMFDAFAVAAPGLEPIVAAELTGLGVQAVKVLEGGVEFPATRRELYDANLRLRTASRVLIRLAGFRAVSFAELERRARAVPYEQVIAPGTRVLLRVTCRKSRLYHSGAVAERLTRDLVARFNVPVSTAPNAESDDEPGTAQLIVVRLDHDRCTVSADSSGAHLHQRGYRVAVTRAPMRETLAAAVILASGWDRRSALVDPFCGSGTIPIEAALLSANIAPGIGRAFRCTQWPGADAAEWHKVRDAASRGADRTRVPLLVAADRSGAAIRAARDNATRAGVAGLLSFEQRDAIRSEAPPNAIGWVVSNPPYGVRLGDRAEANRLYAALGKMLRERFGGWHVSLLTQSNPQRQLGFSLRPTLQTTNGGLRVELVTGVVSAQP